MRGVRDPEQRLASGGLEATLQAALRKLWTETGDLLSIQYTGTANLSKGTNITGTLHESPLLKERPDSWRRG